MAEEQVARTEQRDEPERPEEVMLRGPVNEKRKLPLRDRTWWIILNALGIPIYVALFGVVLNIWQNDRQENLAATQQAVQRDIEEGRAQDNILQSYLDDMTTLMLMPEFENVPRKLCGGVPSGEISPIETIARSRSLVVSTQLEKARLGVVVRFLAQLHLLELINCKLVNADLAGADLQAAILIVTNLRGADLSGANLGLTDLRGANLNGANLSGAILIGAQLNLADLGGADLSGANLTVATLYGADLSGATFDENTTLPDNSMWTPGTDMTRFTNLPEATPDPTTTETPTP